MRKRAAIILIEKEHVALIKRVRDGKTYYVFPGGGVEEGESTLEAAKREAMEELGLDVEIGACVFELTGTAMESYFLAIKTGGEFGKGIGSEYTAADPERGSYEAVWMPLEKLKSINLYPEQLAIKISQNSTK